MLRSGHPVDDCTKTAYSIIRSENRIGRIEMSLRELILVLSFLSVTVPFSAFAGYDNCPLNNTPAISPQHMEIRVAECQKDSKTGDYSFPTAQDNGTGWVTLKKFDEGTGATEQVVDVNTDRLCLCIGFRAQKDKTGAFNLIYARFFTVNVLPEMIDKILMRRMIGFYEEGGKSASKLIEKEEITDPKIEREADTIAIDEFQKYHDGIKGKNEPKSFKQHAYWTSKQTDSYTGDMNNRRALSSLMTLEFLGKKRLKEKFTLSSNLLHYSDNKGAVGKPQVKWIPFVIGTGSPKAGWLIGMSLKLSDLSMMPFQTSNLKGKDLMLINFKAQLNYRFQNKL